MFQRASFSVPVIYILHRAVKKKKKKKKGEAQMCVDVCTVTSGCIEIGCKECYNHADKA